jgi:hypothetical protein
VERRDVDLADLEALDLAHVRERRADHLDHRGVQLRPVLRVVARREQVLAPHAHRVRALVVVGRVHDQVVDVVARSASSPRTVSTSPLNHPTVSSVTIATDVSPWRITMPRAHSPSPSPTSPVPSPRTPMAGRLCPNPAMYDGCSTPSPSPSSGPL